MICRSALGRLALTATLVASVNVQTGAAQDGTGFWDTWQQRATATQAEQPRWVTPVVTVTPRLEQEIRLDASWRTAADGTTTANYGNNKGLELIPAKGIEVILGVPSYVTHGNPAVANGWTDLSFLAKYRIASGNEQHGNYILTAFMGVSVPTGSNGNGNGHVVITPTIAAGKGWGAFDVQTTLGQTEPTEQGQTLGHPLLSNTAFQYHVSRFLWPEFEVNTTWWPDGKDKHDWQVFLTPGVVFGRFPIHDRLGITVGGAVQIAATTFHTSNHNWILSGRMPF